MNVAFALLTLVPFATPGPSPLDAYRANLASIKVDTTFRYQEGRADPALVGRLWTLKEPEFDTFPDFGEHDQWHRRVEITGRWARGGAAELVEYATPDGVLQKIKAKNSGRLKRGLSNYAPYDKGLFDGTIVVQHDVEPGRASGPITVSVNDNPMGFLIQGSSPFVWWGNPFPRCLTELFPSIQPERHTALRDGHAVVVETYAKLLENPPGATSRLEISYDPAIGYLPRYARRLVTSGGDAQVSEMYLVEAR